MVAPFTVSSTINAYAQKKNRPQARVCRLAAGYYGNFKKGYAD